MVNPREQYYRDRLNALSNKKTEKKEVKDNKEKWDIWGILSVAYLIVTLIAMIWFLVIPYLLAISPYLGIIFIAYLVGREHMS